jgi:hypothetical protein
LESKKSGIICLLAAIANKCLIAFYFSSLHGDKALYLLMAKGFLQKGIMAEPVSIFETGGTIYAYDPGVHSPLYSLLAAPFLWLTKSFFQTQYILSVLGWILFFTALYKVASLVFRQRWLVHLFILLAGFFLYPHELSSTPKDTFAVALLLWSVVLLHRFIHQSNWKITGLLAITLSALALVKLLYIPLVIVVIFLLVLFLFLERKKHALLQVGLLLLLLLIVGVAVHQFILQPTYYLAENTTVALPKNANPDFTKGFYPQNLLATFPFFSSSLINTNFWGVQVEKMTPFSYGQVMNFFLLMDVILFIGLLVAAFFFLRKSFPNKVLFSLIILSLAMVATVFYLSVTQKAIVYKSAADYWTFVSDARSFILPILTFQLLLFLFIFRFIQLAFLRWLFLVLLVFEGLHGVYFTAKQIISLPLTENTNAETNPHEKVITLLQKETHLSLATSDEFLRRYAAVKGVRVFSFTNQPPGFNWIKKGDSFLIVTHPEDSLYRKKLPQKNIVAVDTLPPFILQKLQFR